jgi:hypothetical protein
MHQKVNTCSMISLYPQIRMINHRTTQVQLNYIWVETISLHCPYQQWLFSNIYYMQPMNRHCHTDLYLLPSSTFTHDYVITIAFRIIFYNQNLHNSSHSISSVYNSRCDSAQMNHKKYTTIVVSRRRGFVPQTATTSSVKWRERAMQTHEIRWSALDLSGAAHYHSEHTAIKSDGGLFALSDQRYIKCCTTYSVESATNICSCVVNASINSMLSG